MKTTSTLRSVLPRLLALSGLLLAPALARAETASAESNIFTLDTRGAGASLNLSSLDGAKGFVINGIDRADHSGGSVSSAGDVNGDGFDDLIIGARGANSNAGKSYVVFGKAGGFGASLALSSLDGSNGFVINGIDPQDSSGSVSGAGDVNGDGFDDLIIGAYHADPGGKFNAGESYVVFGKASGFGASLELSSLDGNNGFVINGIDPHDTAGESVSGAGDVNGDGFDDLIIGARSASPWLVSNQGQSYVVFGKAGTFAASLELSSLDGNNGFVINGIDQVDWAGDSVSGAGDVNGDGFDDLIIGALIADPGGKDGAGESYVIFGGNFTGMIQTATVLTKSLNINGEFEMQFIRVSGIEYVVEYSSDLSNWNTLTTLVGYANSKLIVDVDAVGQSRRFYRVATQSEE